MWKFLILSVGEAIESGRLLARPFAGDCKSASALGSSTSAERLKHGRKQAKPYTDK